MKKEVDWARVTHLLEELYTASAGLEALFPGRKFTLDGHLVGSIGEVVAAYMFDLELNPASTTGHDARALDGRQVEIKLTQGTSVAIRHEPQHAIVLLRPRGGHVEVIYNGPGDLIWAAARKKQENGARPITISRLRKLQANIPMHQRMAVVRAAPI